MNKAEKNLIKGCQADAFSEEIMKINSSGAKPSIVKQLCLFLDEDGCIRCRGRICYAEMANETKNPYLLPKKDTVTYLIIRDAHQRNGHSGTNATVSYIRQKFRIPAIRQAVNSVTRKWETCKLVNGKHYLSPESPSLPSYRTEESTPFTTTGIDFTGALFVKKIAMEENPKPTFACLHVLIQEQVNDLSEHSFLQAFRRFAGRKSMPKLIISDNAPTFKSAATYLKHLFESKSIQEKLTNMRVNWKFITKAAPWYGGFWERLIGITKFILKKIIGRSYRFRNIANSGDRG